MNEITPETTVDSGRDAHPPSLAHSPKHMLPVSTDLRIMELEMENSRLQRLVAELLFKNQQLRKESD